MSDLEMYLAFQSLPEDLKKEVVDFIQFLKSKRSKNVKTRKFGALKGKIRIAKDFDEPIRDFEKYS